MDGKAILDIAMSTNDAKARTVRDYLKALLREVWVQEESFSGKRPFGNSGWQGEVAAALIKAKTIPGELDSDGYVNRYDQSQMDEAVRTAIEALA